MVLKVEVEQSVANLLHPLLLLRAIELDIDPNATGSAYFSRSYARYLLDDFQGAIDDAARAIEILPDCDFQGAINDYKQVIRLNPEYAPAYANLGAILHQEGQYSEAEAVLQQAIRLDPNDALSYSNLGAALYKQQRYEEAIEAFQEALVLEPENALIHYNLGLALQRTG